MEVLLLFILLLKLFEVFGQTLSQSPDREAKNRIWPCMKLCGPHTLVNNAYTLPSRVQTLCLRIDSLIRLKNWSTSSWVCPTMRKFILT